MNDSELLDRARSMDSPADRRIFLQQACAGDETRMKRLASLLDLALDTPTISTSNSQPGGEFDPPTAFERAGDWIGPYQLVEEIGRGGMGVVYRAEQTEPVKRQVALKIIKPGLDSRAVLSRFNAERQALALMDHPNIARVLDGGATVAGRPYFAMELVNGVPITSYCDTHRLTTNQRLELFIPVCRAVQHAHQKGIIHRDLKPSNILVTEVDGRPVPKVIDFGVAKAIHQESAEQTAFTVLGQVVGTLEYMSPEQARRGDLDIDTRSDTYSLGVILYELLTGTTPFDPQLLRTAGWDEMLRMIREEEPQRPSTRLSSAGTRPNIAAVRRIDPARLSGALRGDLDWIVMKTLEKDRDRRYQTANGLAADIERFLQNEPVTAGPPSTRYRIGKFVRRHRAAVAMGAVLTGALLTGLFGTTWQAVRARRAEQYAIQSASEAFAARDATKRALDAEAKRAEGERAAKQIAEQRLSQLQKSNLVLASIFEDLDLWRAEKDDEPLGVRLGKRLETAARELSGESVGDPLTVARLQMALGHSQQSLGQGKRSIELFEQAAETFSRQLGSEHIETLDAMNDLAASYQIAGDFDAAIPRYLEVLELARKHLDAKHATTQRVLNNLGLAYQAVGKPDAAIPLLQESLELSRAAQGPDDRETLMSINNLALAYRRAGELDKAASLFEEALVGMKQHLGPEHAYSLVTTANLGLAYLDLGQFTRSIALSREAVRLGKLVLGEENPETLNYMNNLAAAYRDDGQLDQAIEMQTATIDQMKSILGAEHPYTLNALRDLATTHLLRGDSAAAKAQYQELLATQRRLFPEADPRLVRTLTLLGQAFLDSAEPEQAESPLREAIAILEKADPGRWSVYNARALLGESLLGQSKDSAAEPLLLEGYEGMKQRESQIPFSGRSRLRASLEQIIKLYERQGKTGEAARWRSELEARSAPSPSTD